VSSNCHFLQLLLLASSNHDLVQGYKALQFSFLLLGFAAAKKIYHSF